MKIYRIAAKQPSKVQSMASLLNRFWSEVLWNPLSEEDREAFIRENIDPIVEQAHALKLGKRVASHIRFVNHSEMLMDALENKTGPVPVMVPPPPLGDKNGPHCIECLEPFIDPEMPKSDKIAREQAEFYNQKHEEFKRRYEAGEFGKPEPKEEPEWPQKPLAQPNTLPGDIPEIAASLWGTDYTPILNTDEPVSGFEPELPPEEDWKGKAANPAQSGKPWKPYRTNPATKVPKSEQGGKTPPPSDIPTEMQQDQLRQRLRELSQQVKNGLISEERAKQIFEELTASAKRRTITGGK